MLAKYPNKEANKCMSVLLPASHKTSALVLWLPCSVPVVKGNSGSTPEYLCVFTLLSPDNYTETCSLITIAFSPNLSMKRVLPIQCVFKPIPRQNYLSSNGCLPFSTKKDVQHTVVLETRTTWFSSIFFHVVYGPPSEITSYKNILCVPLIP